MATDTLHSQFSTPRKAGPLDRFPPEVRDAHARFMATHDIEALDVVVLAIVRKHQTEEARAKTDAAFPDSAHLVHDLGFDSLALAEIVFFIEDLYDICISNEEIARIATVGDLRSFVRARFSPASPASSTLRGT